MDKSERESPATYALWFAGIYLAATATAMMLLFGKLIAPVDVIECCLWSCCLCFPGALPAALLKDSAIHVGGIVMLTPVGCVFYGMLFAIGWRLNSRNASCVVIGVLIVVLVINVREYEMIAGTLLSSLMSTQ